MRNIVWPAIGVGWIVAFLVLVICLVLAVVGKDLSPTYVLALIAALAVARLLP